MSRKVTKKRKKYDSLADFIASFNEKHDEKEMHTNFFDLSRDENKTAYLLAQIASRAVKRVAEKEGRPYVKLDPTCMQLLGMLPMNQRQLLELLQISKPAFDHACERDENVMIAYNHGKSLTYTRVAHSLLDQAVKGNVAAQTFYLKTQGEWREQEQQEQADNGISINFHLGNEDNS